MAYRENINEYDDKNEANNMNFNSSPLPPPPPPPFYLDNSSSNSFSNHMFDNNINGQINIDFLLQRLNSTVSRMSMDEDICLDIEDERDLLHEQLPLDTFENLMREIQDEYAWASISSEKLFLDKIG